jgi:hypothetical protein
MTVLCGHTHGNGVAQLMPNLTAYTGEASYGSVGFRVVKVDGNALSIT